MILNSPTISGSLTVTGNIIASGSITLSGSVASSSFAATASFVALAQSASNAVSAQTASFVALAQSASNAVSSATASFANAFTVASTLTAQTLVVQTITSSVDFVTGSTRFGSISANTHVFTGSVITSGSVGIGTTPAHSLTLVGGQTTPGSFSAGNYTFGIYSGSVSTVLRETFAIGSDASYVYMQSFSSRPLYINRDGNNIILGSNAAGVNVGIGTVSPAYALDINGVSKSSGSIISSNNSSGTPSTSNTLWMTESTTNTNWQLYIGGSTNSFPGGFSILQSTNARMVIASGSGNVGIGLTSPGSILEVSKDTDGDTPIYFTNGSGGASNTNASITLEFRLRNGSGGSTGGVRLRAGKETDHQGANVNDYFAISTTKSDAMAERFRIASDGVTTLKGPTMTTGTQATYALAVGESGYPHLTIGYKASTAGYIQTWASTALYLNQQGNAAYAGAVRLDTLSDQRIKDNIQPISGCLDKILQLNGKKFHLKDEPEDKIRYGFIAQDLEGILDEFVIQTDMTFTKGDLVVENVKSIENWASSWAALLVEAIKELKTQNDALQSRIETLESK
jgi:hypothetical protein